MPHTKQQIVSHIQALESEQVKSLVLNWLVQTSGNVVDFEQLLAEYENTNDGLVYGELNEDLAFQPMTEVEMVESSLEVLEEYKRSGQSLPNDQVRDWLDSHGTDHPLPCPK
jgi:hypothetical protein